MFRQVKLVASSVVAGAAVLAAAQPASAQGRMFFRPMPVMNSGFAFNQAMTPMMFNAIQRNAIQQPNRVQFQRDIARLTRTSSVTGPYDARFLYPAIYGGGYGGYGGYAYPMAYDTSMYQSLGGYGYGMSARDASYLREAQNSKDAGYGKSTGTERKTDLLKNAPDAVTQAMSNPPEKDINSGQALNVLLKVIPGLVAAGGRAEVPFLPPDLLSKVTFAGGAEADALNMVRTGKIEFPPAMLGTEFDAQRAAIENDLAAASRLVREGKTIDPALVDRLAADIQRLHPKAPADPATEAALARLDAAARFLKSADANGLFVPSWQTEGTTLRDLGQFMSRYKLEFGPAAPGAEPLYWALHRAMAKYVHQLAIVNR
jgi:hypothetical protein